MKEYVRDDGVFVLTDGVNVLEIPQTDFGSPRVFYNGNRIPSVGIWALITDALASGVPADRIWLMREARRAEIYRLVAGQKLVVTTTMRSGDEVTSMPDVFLRSEPQRVRPLINEWNLLPGVIEGVIDSEKVKHLIDAANELGFHPVSENAGRYYFSNTPEKVTEALKCFGVAEHETLVWKNKFPQRPGGSQIFLDLTGFTTYDECENNGTVAITSCVSKPLQGTYIGMMEDQRSMVLAKGIIRPPLALVDKDIMPYRVEQNNQACQQAAFKHSIMDAPKGTFYTIGALGREQCRMNYQTVLFDIKDPVALIRQDNKRFLDMSALDFLTEENKRKVIANVPAALLLDSLAPWKWIRSFDVPGIRGTVFGSELVPIGSFMLLPDAGVELREQFHRATGAKSNCVGQYFLVHKDPALPDATCTFFSKYAGIVCWSTKQGVSYSGYGVVLNPRDPAWKLAGGDFDGDAANIFVPNPSVQPREYVLRINFRQDGRKYSGSTVREQMVEEAANQVTSLLGPAVLGAMKLCERQLDTDEIRINAASVAQAAVEAKKHYVDVDAVTDRAQLLFLEVKQGEQEGTNFYLSSLMNELKRANGNQAKLDIWNRLVAWKPGPVASSVETAMQERIELLNQLYRDTGFLRAQTRTELPSILRLTAKALCTSGARDEVKAMTQRHYDLLSEFAALAGDYDEDSREGQAQEVKEGLRTLREEFRLAALTGIVDGKALAAVGQEEPLKPRDVQLAMIGYAPARIAAQCVPAETFESLGTVSSEGFVNLFGTHWTDGAYKPEDLTPIYNCQCDFRLITKDATIVQVSVINRTARSTRVHLRVVR